MKKFRKCKFLDLTGKKFGKLTVIGRTDPFKKKNVWFDVKCECGKIETRKSWSLTSGESKSCKTCALSKNALIIKPGTRFGMLQILELSHIHKRDGRYYKVKCDCGKEIVKKAWNLLNTGTSCCGCQKETGKKNWKYKGCGLITGTNVSFLRQRARIKKIKFNLTARFLWKLFQKQGGKCALSGIPLGFEVSRHLARKATGSSSESASLDRTDPTKGYIKGNVKWVHKNVNYGKHKQSDEEYVQLCKKVVEFNKK